jgi:uncharacterized membrane protein YcfT
MDYRFFLMFVLTVVFVRAVLYFHPVPAPTIAGFRIHHYMYGLAAVAIGLATVSLPIYSIGLGLFIDELTFVLTGGKTHHDNYSLVSILGTAVLVCVVFVLKRCLVRPFEV